MKTLPPLPPDPLRVYLVPYGRIHDVYGQIIEYIRKMEPWCFGRMGVDDICATLFSRHVQTWVVQGENSHCVYGYLTTEIRLYPQMKVLCVLNCGGEDGKLDECIDTVFDVFERYARDTGCDAIDFQGRPGWARFAKAHGYNSPMRHYFKPLNGSTP